MVKWSDTWLNKVDMNGVQMKLWATKKNDDYASCAFCASDIKYNTAGFHALYQHSGKGKHKEVSKNVVSSNAARIKVNVVPTSDKDVPKRTQLTIDCSLKDKASAAEATWVFFTAENDLTLRCSDGSPAMFQRMFPDSKITQEFTMSRQKCSYVIQDGIGPLLLRQLCQTLSSSTCCYTLMFDETSTSQTRKQMDLLVRYWCETEDRVVVTKYLTSLFFWKSICPRYRGEDSFS